MENVDPKNKEFGEAPKLIEDDYESHKENPAPGKPALTEKSENGAGSVLRWIIPVAIIIGIIVWFAMKK